jgi:carbonic anhydrase
MAKTLEKLKAGYNAFREQYAHGSNSFMDLLSKKGQNPKVMIVACSDSRVDPALLLQCDPGDLFIVRNVANIIPPYEKDNRCHGTSAALEFGICHLKIDHLIIMGHSQCGGIETLTNQESLGSDFIENWVASVSEAAKAGSIDACAQAALHQSYQHALSFPWVKERLDASKLQIHRWFFDIKTGNICCYEDKSRCFVPLNKE